MAPEIVEGKQLDFRTDVFAVGIMLYLLATGEPAVPGKNPHEVLRRITEGNFTDPRMVGRGVDQALSRIITKALARRPEDRYSDVGPMADELRAYLADAGLGDITRRAARVLRRPGRLRGRAAQAAGRRADRGGDAPPGRRSVGEGAGDLEPRARVRSRTTPWWPPRCAGWRAAPA